MITAYVASPYNDPDPAIRQKRYEAVCDAVAKLAKKDDYALYSPIMHCHPIACIRQLPTDAMFWKNQNESMIDCMDVMIVLQLDGWFASKGVKMEIEYARAGLIPIIYMKPEEL